MNKIFDVKAIWEYLPKILEGLPVTLGLTVVAMVLGVVLGFGMAIARIRKIPVLSQFCSVYLFCPGRTAHGFAVPVLLRDPDSAPGGQLRVRDGYECEHGSGVCVCPGGICGSGDRV